MNLFGSLNLLTALFIVGIVKRNSNGYILYNAILMIYELISVKDFGKELKETAQIIHTKDLPEEERITIKSKIMNEIKKDKQGLGTGKAAYVKPIMQVYEMELEDAVLAGANSGHSGGDYGRDYPQAAPARKGTWGNLMENKEIM